MKTVVQMQIHLYAFQMFKHTVGAYSMATPGFPHQGQWETTYKLWSQNVYIASLPNCYGCITVIASHIFYR